jgi:hypothetical protein
LSCAFPLGSTAGSTERASRDGEAAIVRAIEWFRRDAR